MYYSWVKMLRYWLSIATIVNKLLTASFSINCYVLLIALLDIVMLCINRNR